MKSRYVRKKYFENFRKSFEVNQCKTELYANTYHDLSIRTTYKFLIESNDLPRPRTKTSDISKASCVTDVKPPLLDEFFYPIVCYVLKTMNN